LTVFTRTAFSGDADKAGLQMAPTQMLIFGSPQSGHTIDARRAGRGHRPAAQGLGLGRWRRKRHGLPEALNIAGIKALVEQATR
jgi:hypothetical protein